ncbi:hypothetical protein ACI2KR_06890 [Pseudomonas luteola]
MTEDEFNQLPPYAGSNVAFRADDLKDLSDRTLLVGEHGKKNTFHAYIQGGKVHAIIYSPDYELIKQINDDLSLLDLTINNRFFPEACDGEACMAMINKGIALSFKTYQESRTKKPWGFTYFVETHHSLINRKVQIQI